jgi:Tfp pilus assembly protein PilF
MKLNIIIAIAGLVALQTAGAAPHFNEHGRCTDGCNYFDGDAEHINVVEKYHLGPAKEKLASGRANYAMEDIEFILRHFPNNPNALLLLDAAAKALKQPALPDRYFKAALDAYPDEPMTYVVHAMFLQKRGQTGAAIEQYEHALSLNPNLPDAHYNLGLALVQAKRYAEANTHAQAAIRLGHPMPGLRNQLKRVGAWKPDAGAPSSASTTAASAPAKDALAAPAAKAEAAPTP